MATGSEVDSESWVHQSHLNLPSINLPNETADSVMCVRYRPNWMNSIILYLQEGILPQDPKVARMLRGKAAHYTLVDQTLYRRSFLSPLLKCLDCSEADYCMLEIHEGICGSHSARTTLAHKTLR